MSEVPLERITHPAANQPHAQEQPAHIFRSNTTTTIDNIGALRPPTPYRGTSLIRSRPTHLESAQVLRDTSLMKNTHPPRITIRP
jgi:hypothetical protein